MQRKQRKMQRKMQRKRNGFTIMEILVVIAIIIILVAMVIAVGASVKSSGQRHTTKIVLKDLYAIYGSFIQDGNAPINANTPFDSTTVGNVQLTLGITPQQAAEMAFLDLAVQDPHYGNAISSLPSQVIQKVTLVDGKTHLIAVDGFGNWTTLVYGTKIYFQSNGPDGATGANFALDDLYSYDP